MITQEVIAFIKGQLATGASKESISKMLQDNGWMPADIAEAFAQAVPPVVSYQTSAPIQPVESVKTFQRVEPTISQAQPVESLRPAPVIASQAAVVAPKSSKMLIWILVVLLLIVIAVAGYMVWMLNVQKNAAVQSLAAMQATQQAQQAANTQASVPADQNPANASGVAIDTTNWKTYSSTKLGFSFKYPDTWKLVEDLTKKTVTITSDSISDQYKGVPLEQITFKATNKSFFTPPVVTKVGAITYDNASKSLVADGCLPASPLFGSAGSIAAVNYGGSLMSDPAYSDSAILTKSDLIVISHRSMEAGSGEATNTLAQNQAGQVGASFSLVNNNEVFVPACTPAN
ncbi:MAG: hypothetical protein JWM20_481 [Patescibacteria group bacterium]|nr:hypothetical protein [Patescibacteria group bacterium]